MLIKRIELIANLAIILVAVLLGVVLVRNHLQPKLPALPQSAANRPIPPGTKLSLAGVDWKGNGRTVVLALSTGCHFCTESAPFYQRVAQERAKAGHLRLVAVFPESVSEGQKYLSNLGVTVDEVRQARLDSIGVIGTPTLIMTDGEGAVAESWRGKLSSEKESEVLRRFR
jgi:thiol-disulfide isomerase/thioredoxin